MKLLPCILILICIISCQKRTEHQQQYRSNEETIIEKPKALMSFIDNDTLFHYSFNSYSEFDGIYLRWKISIYKHETITQTIEDSIKGKSYLVKAIDLNNDSIAELVYVTADFIPIDDSTEVLKPTIFIYHRKNGAYIKKLVPDQSHQLAGGKPEGEVVEVTKKGIEHTFLYSDTLSDEPTEKKLLYRLSKTDDIIITTLPTQ